MTASVPQNAEKQPCIVHCSECRHEWTAFYWPLTLDQKGIRLLKAVSKMPCPMCAEKKVFMGPAPKTIVSPQPQPAGA